MKDLFTIEFCTKTKQYHIENLEKIIDSNWRRTAEGRDVSWVLVGVTENYEQIEELIAGHEQGCEDSKSARYSNG